MSCDISLTLFNSNLNTSGRDGFEDFPDTIADTALAIHSSALNKPGSGLSTSEDFPDMPSDSSTCSDSALTAVNSDLNKPGREASPSEDPAGMPPDSTLNVLDSDLNKLLRELSLNEDFPDTGNLINVDGNSSEGGGGGGGPKPLPMLGGRSRGNSPAGEGRVRVIAESSERGTGVRMRTRNYEAVPEEEIARGLLPLSEKPVKVRHRGLNNLFMVLVDGTVSMQHVQPARVMQAVFSRQRLFHSPSSRVLTLLQHVTSRSYVAVSPSKERVISVPGTTFAAAAASTTTTTTTATASPYLSSSNAEVTVSLHRSSGPDAPLLSSPSGGRDLPMACLFVETRAGPHVCLQPALLHGKSLECIDGRLIVVPSQRMAFQFQSAEEAFKSFVILGKMFKCCRVVLMIVRLQKS